MSISDFDVQFHDIMRQNGLERFCKEPIVSQFECFTEHFQSVNAHTNLSAIRETSDIITKHYADCLLAEPHFQQSATVLDVGCGGGFPSIPLSIVRPDLKITALDSTAKKINFVDSAKALLDLSNLEPICTRVEDTTFSSRKQTFDIGTSRAVARLSVLVELVLPFIKVGGQLITLKGPSGIEELQNAKQAIRILGGEVSSINDCVLKQGDLAEQRTIIVINKISATPPQSPRQYSAILKKPL